MQYAEDINNAASDGKDIAPLRQRVDLWTNRYNEIVNDARIHFVGKQYLEWIYGDTEHCSTCASLNGIVATAEEWEASGYHPQGAPNDKLECGGWRCQCSLEPTDKKPTEGGIMSDFVGIDVAGIDEIVKKLNALPLEAQDEVVDTVSQFMIKSILPIYPPSKYVTRTTAMGRRFSRTSSGAGSSQAWLMVRSVYLTSAPRAWRIAGSRSGPGFGHSSPLKAQARNS